MDIILSLDGAYYLQRRFSDPTDKERGAQPFYLKSIHDFYQGFGKNWNSDTARLLEYGGGPVIYPLISASPFVNEIVFVDYLKSNIDLVALWKNESPGQHNWEPYFRYVISELEGNDIEDTVIMRQKDLRKKLADFVIGNLYSEQILASMSLQCSEGEKFDIISSHFCLEAVATSISEYQLFLQKLSKLLKPGGYILSMVSLEESYWIQQKNTRSFHLFLTEKNVKEAYEMAGFVIVQTNIHQLPESARFLLNDCKSLMFIGAKKTK